MMQSARRLSFYSLRRMHNRNAFRLFIFAIFLFACAYWLPFYGEPMIYVYFPPSPTITMTPTVSMTPTISMTPSLTLVPSQTLTPSVSDTPTLTTTPFIPVAIESLFQGQLTPNPDAVFTAIQFSTEFDGTNAVDPKTVFELPIKTMYGGFDYNNTIPGVQWSVLWYRNGQLVDYQTEPWREEWSTGGIGGFVESTNPIGGWLPGTYEVQIFMAYEWKVVGRFIVLDNLSTPTSTPTSTPFIERTVTPAVTP